MKKSKLKHNNNNNNNNLLNCNIASQGPIWKQYQVLTTQTTQIKQNRTKTVNKSQVVRLKFNHKLGEKFKGITQMKFETKVNCVPKY